MLKEKTAQIHAVRLKIRTTRKDSAFLYHLLESHEGLTAYSTLEFKEGDLFRDVELLFSPDQASEVHTFLEAESDFVTILA